MRPFQGLTGGRRPLGPSPYRNRRFRLTKGPKGPFVPQSPKGIVVMSTTLRVVRYVLTILLLSIGPSALISRPNPSGWASTRPFQGLVNRIPFRNPVNRPKPTFGPQHDVNGLISGGRFGPIQAGLGQFRPPKSLEDWASKPRITRDLKHRKLESFA